VAIDRLEHSPSDKSRSGHSGDISERSRTQECCFSIRNVRFGGRSRVSHVWLVAPVSLSI